MKRVVDGYRMRESVRETICVSESVFETDKCILFLILNDGKTEDCFKSLNQ